MTIGSKNGKYIELLSVVFWIYRRLCKFVKSHGILHIILRY